MEETDRTHQQTDSRKRSFAPLAFDFPLLQEHPSIRSLMSHSRSINMDDGVQIERPSSSLSESWATLSSSDLSLDDNQSQSTDHASLLDHHTPEDVHSLTGDESESVQDDGGEEDRPWSPEPPQRHTPEASAIYETQDSAVTAKFSPFEAIEFQEPQSWPEAEMVNLKHTIRVFDESETRCLSERLFPALMLQEVTGTFLGTTRMTMCKTPLKLERPFRVLFAGDIWARGRILQKLTEALNAARTQDMATKHGISRTPKPESCSTPTLSTVVPGDPQLVVDDCLSAVLFEEPSGSRSITVSFKDFSLFTSRLDRFSDNKSVFEISSASSWNPPDLAIIAVSSRDTLKQQDSNKNVQAFALRHHIPEMMIMDEAPWNSDAGYSLIGLGDLHLCIESRAISATEPVVLKQLPVDLETFESIEPGQLNRNLACLLSIAAAANDESLKDDLPKYSEEKDFDEIEMLRSKWHGLLDAVLQQNHFMCQILQHPVLELGLFVCGLSIIAIASYNITYWGGSWLCYCIIQLSSFLGSIFGSASTKNPSSSVASNAATPAQTITSAFSSTMPASAKTSTDNSLQSSLPKSLSTVSTQLDLAQLLSDPTVYAANRSENFQVQVIGDHHIIIKAPQRLANKRKSRAFEVTIERGNTVINYTMAKLFDGVYTIAIDLDEAHGPLNVTVTVVKPFSVHAYELDFGSAWLKPAGWKRAGQVVSEQVRKDLVAAQDNFLKAYVQVSEDLRVRVKEVSKMAIEASGELQEQSRAIAKGTTDLVNRELGELKKAARQHSKISKKLRKKIKLLGRGTSKFVRSSTEMTRVLAGDASRTVRRNTKKLSEAASRVDLSQLTDQLNVMTRSKYLATAQDRAQRILKEKGRRLARQVKVESTTNSKEKSCKSGRGHRRRASCNNR